MVSAAAHSFHSHCTELWPCWNFLSAAWDLAWKLRSRIWFQCAFTTSHFASWVSLCCHKAPWNRPWFPKQGPDEKHMYSNSPHYSETWGKGGIKRRNNSESTSYPFPYISVDGGSRLSTLSVLLMRFTLGISFSFLRVPSSHSSPLSHLCACYKSVTQITPFNPYNSIQDKYLF